MATSLHRVDADLHRKLEEWTSAGLISEAEARAVETYEAQQLPERPGRMPLVAEAVAYIGGSLIIAAVAVVVGGHWDELSTAARVAVLASPATLFAVIGGWAGARGEDALRRLGSVLWVLAGAALAGALTEVWIDVVHDGDAPDHGGVLFVGGLTFAAVAAAWWARREPLQHLAMFAASVATAVGIVDATTASGEELSAPGVGLALIVVAVTWLAGGLTRLVAPCALSMLTGAVLLVIGPQFVVEGMADLGMWLGIASAVALMATGIARSEVVVLAPGTIGLFVWTPQVALFYLEDVLGAAATLAVIGVLLLVLAGGLVRVYPSIRTRLATGGPRAGSPVRS